MLHPRATVYPSRGSSSYWILVKVQNYLQTVTLSSTRQQTKIRNYSYHGIIKSLVRIAPAIWAGYASTAQLSNLREDNVLGFQGIHVK